MGSDNDRINIGNVKRKRFELPLDVVTQATAILGRRGSGKTNTGVRVVEGVLANGLQAVVMDPLDVWWGLKSSRSGKSEGMQILLIGDARKAHTDMPLRESDGEAIADFLVDEQMPCILSTRHLSKSARRRFSAAFLERFYHRKGDPGKDTPCLLVIDEASMVVPQTMREPEQARCVGAVEQCVRQGRASGIGAMLIDQRPASVNKDVLTQVELMVTHQLTSPQDRKALQEWVRANDIDGREKDFMASLASLEIGEAWFWSPAWLRCFDRVKVKLRDTFDSSATPKAGESRLQVGKVATFDLETIKGQLSASIEQARATDPKVLNKRIAELERDLKAARSAEPDAEAVSRAVAQAEANVRAWAKTQGMKLIEDFRGFLAKIESDGDALSLAWADALGSDPPATPRIDPDKEKKARAISVKHGLVAPKADCVHVLDIVTSTPRTPVDGVSRPQQLIIDKLAWFESVGLACVSRSNVAAMAGVSPRSSGYKKNVSTLSTLGYLRYPSTGDLSLTEEGRLVARPSDAPLTASALHRAWFGCKAISGPMGVLLEILIGIYPDTIARDDLAERAGVSALSSGYKKNVSSLSSLGLVFYPEQGSVSASELLFPAALMIGGSR